MTTIRSTDSKSDIPLHFDMGLFGPSGSMRAFVPGTAARLLEHVPFARGLAARLYTTAGRWVRDDAEHFMPEEGRGNAGYMRRIAADHQLEGAFYFANAGRLELMSGGADALRLGLLNYIDAKEQINAVTEVKDTPQTRLMQARIYRGIRVIHHMSNGQSGIGWMSKELEIIQKGLSHLKDAQPTQIRSELTLYLIEVSHELAHAHIREANNGLKAHDAAAAKKHLEAAASINGSVGQGLVGRDALEFTIEAIDCYKAILANIHELSAEDRLSTLRSLAGAYSKAGEHYRELHDLARSAEMYYHAGTALEYAIIILDETGPVESRSSDIKREYHEVLRELTSAARAFGDTGELTTASDLRAHMRKIDSYLAGAAHHMPEPLKPGYTFKAAQVSVARSILDERATVVDDDMDSLRRLGRRLTPRERDVFLRRFDDAVDGEEAILQLEQFVREHLNNGSASRRTAMKRVRERGLRRTMQDLFGNDGLDTVDRIFLTKDGPTIDRRAKLERRRSIR